jgi:hypothetical protein
MIVRNSQGILKEVEIQKHEYVYFVRIDNNGRERGVRKLDVASEA